ncbi:hypothetical protein GCM10028813_44050 [Ramlibacter alkalitolerans]
MSLPVPSANFAPLVLPRKGGWKRMGAAKVAAPDKGQEVSHSSTGKRATRWRTMAAGSSVKQPDAAVHAGNGFGKTLPPSGLPGYDAAENDRHARGAARPNVRDPHVRGCRDAPGRRREGRPGALMRQL